MEEIDWSKVSIEAASNVGIGTPYIMPKLDINGGCIVGMGDSPYTKFYISGIVSKEQDGTAPHGENCGCKVLKEGDRFRIGMGCPNPNHKIKIN